MYEKTKFELACDEVSRTAIQIAICFAVIALVVKFW